MACSSKPVKFMKIISLILDTGTIALSYRMKHEVKNAGLSFKQFLIANKHKLFHLYERRNCCECISDQRRTAVMSKLQWEILFKTNNNAKLCKKNKPCVCQYEPQVSVAEDDLDLSLLCAILLNVCSLEPGELQDVKNLREKRNYFLHAKSANIEEDVFQREFSSICSTIESIAIHCGQDVLNKVKDEIENISKSQINDNMCRHVLSLLYHIHETSSEQLGNILQEIEQSKTTVQDQLINFGKDLTHIKTHLGIQHASSDDSIRDNIEKCSAIPTEAVTECGFGGTGSVSNDESEKAFKRHIAEENRNEDKNLPKTHQVGKSNTLTSQQLGTKDCVDFKHESLTGKFRADMLLNANELHSKTPNTNKDGNLHQSGNNADSAIQKKGSCLHVSCQGGNLEMTKFLLSTYPELINSVNEKRWNVAHSAAHGGNICILQLLADKGVPVTETTHDNRTILHIACLNAKYEMCQYILSQYPDLLNVVDARGWNVAHCAAEGGDVRILQLLADKGVPVIETTHENYTILYIACFSAKYEMCQYILSQYPDLLNVVDARGWNVAHFAAMGGDVRILQLLAEKGVSVIETTHDDYTILHIACLSAKYEMCQYILSQYPDLLNVVDARGWNVAHSAAQGGDVRILQLLENKGVPVTETTHDNLTILHIACLSAKYEMCQYILSQYPDLLNVVDARGWNVAHCAAQGGDVRILQLLADKGVPVTETTHDNRTILHIACLHAKYEMCQYILSQYPDLLNVVDSWGRNVVHSAAQGGDVRILKLLTDNGVSL